MILVHLTSTDPFYNLALEEYLFANSVEEYLLFYVNAPCVVLGYNQSVQNEVNQEYCNGSQIKVVRRSSGGGAVYHDEGNLNFSFISNATNHADILSEAFLHPVVDWFDALGIQLQIGSRKDLWLKSGKKVCGTASKVKKKRVLNHGTLLISADLRQLKLSLMPEFTDNTVKATKSVRSETANILPEFNVENTNPEEFMRQLFGQVLRYYDQKCFSEPDIDEVLVHEIRQKLVDASFVYRK